MKKFFSSIKIINTVSILFIIYFDLSFYLLDGFKDYKFTFIIVNAFVLFLWYFLNYRYNKESELSKTHIKSLIELSMNYDNDVVDEERELLSENPKYKENENTYKLFKDMYLRKNLIKKEYNDIKQAYLKLIPEGYIEHYLTPDGSAKVSLGLSMKKKLNIMFLDIIGFTTITESIDSEKSLLLLNIYFDGIVDIVKNNNGYVDKFLGDGILAIFDQDSSDNTMTAAVEIQNYIGKFQISEIGKKIAVGIGINTGEVILGAVGSKDRMDVTVIGDVVNTASRLENLTRKLGTSILISSSTYNCIKDKKHYHIHDLGMHSLDGKAEKKHLYSVDETVSVSLKDKKDDSQIKTKKD